MMKEKEGEVNWGKDGRAGSRTPRPKIEKRQMPRRWDKSQRYNDKRGAWLGES